MRRACLFAALAALLALLAIGSVHADAVDVTFDDDSVDPSGELQSLLMQLEQAEAAHHDTDALLLQITEADSAAAADYAAVDDAAEDEIEMQEQEDEEHAEMLETEVQSTALARQHITDWGVTGSAALTFTPGWFDALQRGENNDYCRMVGQHANSFLSCALAGSKQQYSAPGRFRATASGGVERNPCFEKNCGINGKCHPDTGLCSCMHGAAGVNCEIPSAECAKVDCGKNGRCVGGACRCNTGFHGERCESNKCFTNQVNCGQHGVCFNGLCHCSSRWTGPNCQYKARQNATLTDLGLSNNQGANGWFDVSNQSATADAAKAFVKNDYCRWVGKGADIYYSCAMAGSKDQYTAPGLVTFDAGTKQAVLNKCFGVSCVRGSCDAETGSCRVIDAGEKCGAETCSVGGYCAKGKCLCKEGWSGAKCEVDPCATLKCGSHGSCSAGKCVCSQRFEGDRCQFKRRQPVIAEKGRNGVWIDAQKQGAKNDYCRYIDGASGKFVSCALAGSNSAYTPPGAFTFTKGSKTGELNLKVSLIEGSAFDLAAAVGDDKEPVEAADHSLIQHGTTTDPVYQLGYPELAVYNGVANPLYPGPLESVGFPSRCQPQNEDLLLNASAAINALLSVSPPLSGRAPMCSFSAAHAYALNPTQPIGGKAAVFSTSTPPTYQTATGSGFLSAWKGFCVPGAQYNMTTVFPHHRESCRCPGSIAGIPVSGSTNPAQQMFGQYGGSYCEVASCPMPAHWNNPHIEDPVLAQTVWPTDQATQPWPALVLTQSLLQANPLTWHVTYNGTQSPNWWTWNSDKPEWQTPGFSVPSASGTSQVPVNVASMRMMPTYITYKCKPGYQFKAGVNPTIRCDVRNEIFNAAGAVIGWRGAYNTSDTDAWPLAAGACVPSVCPALPPRSDYPILTITAAPVTATGPLYAPGTVITYSCAAGYVPKGTADWSVKCNGNTVWRNADDTADAVFPTEAANCEPAPCPGVLTDPNGVFIPNTGGFKTNSTLTCNAGFFSESLYAYCQSSLTWTGITAEPPQTVAPTSCQPVYCALPEPIPNGSTVGGVLAVPAAVGVSIHFACNPGFALQGAPTITCQQSPNSPTIPFGHWSAAVPACVPSTCPAYAAPANGLIALANGTAFSVPLEGVTGTVLTFTCNTGFSLNGALTSACQSNGQWSTLGSNCVANPCAETFTQLQRGQSVDRTTGSTGTVATFSCAPGFVASGASTRTCGADGLWSNAASLPTCTPMACPAYVAPNPNVQLLPSSGSQYGQSVYFACASGYLLVGPVSVQCRLTADGSAVEWEPLGSAANQQPQCWQSFAMMGQEPTLLIGGAGQNVLAVPYVEISSNVTLTITLSGPAAAGVTVSLRSMTFVPGPQTPQFFDLVATSAAQPGVLEVHFAVTQNTVPALSPPPNLAILVYAEPAPIGRCSVNDNTQLNGGGFGGVGSVAADGLDLTSSGGAPYGFFAGEGGFQSCFLACSKAPACAQAIFEKSSSKCYLQKTKRTASVANPDFMSSTCLASCPTFVATDSNLFVNTPTFSASDAPFPVEGSQAFFQCVERFVMVGSPVSTCGSSGQFDAPMPTCRKAPCADLFPMAPLQASASSGVVGDVVQFSCVTGWSLANPAGSSFVCGPGSLSPAHFLWTNSAQAGSGVTADADYPLCTPNQCLPAAASPLHGKVTGAGVTNTTSVWSCDQGYVQIGAAATIDCTPTGWEAGKNPLAPPACLQQCPAVVAPEFGSLTPGAGSYYHGQTVTVSCNLGYSLQGVEAGTSSQVVSCLDGQYSPLNGVFTCAPLACPAFVVTDPTVITEGSLAASVTGMGLKFSCPAGFDLSGSNSTTCVAGSATASAWSTPFAPVCLARPCPALVQPAHGNLSSVFGVTGSSVTLTCAAGYTAVPSVPMVCGADSKWTESEPACLAQACAPNLVAPADGSATATSGTTGQIVSFSCNAGWTLVGSSASQCLPSNVWSNPAPTCAINSCLALPPILHSQPFPSTATTGATITYACVDGYTLTGAVSNECLTSGAWKNANPTCVPVPCPTLVAPAHGSVSPATGSYGDSATFACGEGFTLSSNPFVACGVNGAWSPAVFPTCIDQCADVQCGAHGACKNGLCECTDRYSGAACDIAPVTYDWQPSEFGACSVECGVGVQERNVTCMGTDNKVAEDSLCVAVSKPATSQPCNTQRCIVFAWTNPAYGLCSASCDGGVQTRVVSCQGDDGLTYPESKCSGPKPAESQACGQTPCVRYSWTAPETFDACPVSCGGGVQTRAVTCIGTDGLTYADSFCVNAGAAAGVKPISSQACQTQICVSYSWLSGPFTACSSTCGGGTQTRDVTCAGSDNTTGNPDAYCSVSSPKPVSVESCSPTACPTFKWVTGEFSSCSLSCGGGVRTRTVVCTGSDATTPGDAACANEGTKPESSEVCNPTACPTYAWARSEWTVCSASCGTGSQSRTIQCVKSIAGVSQGPVADTFCINAGDRLSETQSCNTQRCVVFDWGTPSDWSSCSVACGGGNQTRSVQCLADATIPAEESLCTKPKPVLEQACQTQVCVTYAWESAEWGACSKKCASGVQSRGVLCRGSDALVYEDSSCASQGPKPETEQACNTWACCPKLADILYSTPHPQTGETGDVITYSCINGYYLYPASRTSNECKTTGWSVAMQPLCKPNVCPTLTAPTSGAVVPTTGTYGTKSTYSCNQGFTLSGATETSCQADSTWSAQAPTCVDQCAGVNCGAHGACSLGSCVCSGGYTGSDCSVAPVSFHWAPSDFGVCSASCGAGTESRTVVCAGSDSKTYDDATCAAAGPKPELTRACNLGACVTYAWNAGEYGLCSASCGGGVSTRAVSCVGSDGITYPAAKCTEAAPISQESCNTAACVTFSWSTPDDWSVCSKSCGTGLQTRRVICVGSDGQDYADSKCAEGKPLSQQTCNTDVCVSFTWRAGRLSTCSATCGGGTQTRAVVCAGSDGQEYPDANCVAAERPATSLACNTVACPTFAWVAGEFGGCSSACGGGVRTRTVICTGSDATTPGDAKCSATPKPASTEACASNACPTYAWSNGEWTACTRECAGGQQTRVIQCAISTGGFVDDAFCSGSGPKEATLRACATQACTVYAWGTPSAWSSCSHSCGAGTQTRTVQCLADGAVVAADALCPASSKPVLVQQCNTVACVSYHWNVPAYGSCSKPCGSGVQNRAVTCVGSDSKTYADSFCATGNNGPKPATQQTCNTDVCVTFAWATGEYGLCSATCGGGVQTRSVGCRSSPSGLFVEDAKCSAAGPKPASTLACGTAVCITYAWRAAAFGACSKSCGSGVQTRAVTCWSSGNAQVADAKCVAAQKPVSTQACNIAPCTTYGWVAQAYGACSKTCGGGVQTRVVQCMGSDLKAAAESKCVGQTRPVSTSSCNTQACAPTGVFTWFTGNWQKCSKNCGSGTQTRSVSCKAADGKIVANSNCAFSSPMPPSKQACNTFRCSGCGASFRFCLNLGGKCRPEADVASEFIADITAATGLPASRFEIAGIEQPTSGNAFVNFIVLPEANAKAVTTASIVLALMQQSLNPWSKLQKGLLTSARILQCMLQYHLFAPCADGKHRPHCDRPPVKWLPSPTFCKPNKPAGPLMVKSVIFNLTAPVSNVTAPLTNELTVPQPTYPMPSETVTEPAAPKIPAVIVEPKPAVIVKPKPVKPSITFVPAAVIREHDAPTVVRTYETVHSVVTVMPSSSSRRPGRPSKKSQRPGKKSPARILAPMVDASLAESSSSVEQQLQQPEMEMVESLESFEQAQGL